MYKPKEKSRLEAEDFIRARYSRETREDEGFSLTLDSAIDLVESAIIQGRLLEANETLERVRGY